MLFAQMLREKIRQGMKRNPARITPGRQQRALRPCLTGLEQRLPLDGDASTVAAQIAPPPPQPAVPPANPAAIPAPAVPANMPQQQQLDILRAQIAASAKEVADKATTPMLST